MNFTYGKIAQNTDLKSYGMFSFVSTFICDDLVVMYLKASTSKVSLKN